MTKRLSNLFRNGAYALVIFLLALPVLILFKMRVRGRDLIDAGKEYIIVAHHCSYWDIPLIVVAFGIRNRIQFIAREGLKRNPIFLPLLQLFSTTIDRDNFGRRDFRRILQMMRKERLIGIFPEGTTKAQASAKTGVIHFARLTRKLLLPVHIKANGPYPPRYPFGFPRVTVSIGEAVSLSSLEKEIPALPEKSSERASVLTKRLMERIDAA
ncbi:MAG TPA: 1-acyl-sn-glycerol-3-phosphate acyltransferase [Candidatus Acetothermia bacterium]|nr:1-acyl-sn-glycerol-3-phosphate acyltransferase [Candidatus Acetothermia bacterium]